MNQSLDAVFDARERAERSYLGDRAGDHLAGCVTAGDGRPRIDLRPLDGKRDLLLFFIDTQHLDFNFLADLEHLAGVVDAAPGELADVNQSVSAAQVNERAEVGE